MSRGRETLSHGDISNKDLPMGASFYTVFLCALFGANVVAIKLSLAGLGAFTTASLRFALAVAGISLWARLSGRSFRLKPGQARQVIVFSLFMTVQTALFYFGVYRTDAARAALIINLQPFILLILAHFLIPGDRMNMRKAAGILLGFFGVVLLFSDDRQMEEGLRIGDTIILLGVVLWAFGVVYLKRIIADFDPFHLAYYPMILSLPFLSAAALAFDGPMLDHIDAAVVGSLLFQALVASSFGFVAWNSMLQKYGAVSLHSYLFVIPLTGVALGWAVLGEKVATFNMLTALALIVAGIAVVNSRLQSKRESGPSRNGQRAH